MLSTDCILDRWIDAARIIFDVENLKDGIVTKEECTLFSVAMRSRLNETQKCLDGAPDPAKCEDQTWEDIEKKINRVRPENSPQAYEEMVITIEAFAKEIKVIGKQKPVTLAPVQTATSTSSQAQATLAPAQIETTPELTQM